VKAQIPQRIAEMTMGARERVCTMSAFAIQEPDEFRARDIFLHKKPGKSCRHPLESDPPHSPGRHVLVAFGADFVLANFDQA
jgi:hypothetical protein